MMYCEHPQAYRKQIRGESVKPDVWYTSVSGIGLLCSNEGVNAAPSRNPIHAPKQTQNYTTSELVNGLRILRLQSRTGETGLNQQPAPVERLLHMYRRQVETNLQNQEKTAELHACLVGVRQQAPALADKVDDNTPDVVQPHDGTPSSHLPCHVPFRRANHTERNTANRKAGGGELKSAIRLSGKSNSRGQGVA